MANKLTFVARDRTAQPQDDIRINWSNPITRGLVDIIWSGAGPARYLVGSVKPTVVGQSITTAAGIGRQRDATNAAAVRFHYSPASVNDRFRLYGGITMLTYGSMPRTGTTSCPTGFEHGYTISNRYGEGYIYGICGGVTIAPGTRWSDTIALRGLTYSSPSLRLYENGRVVGSADTGTTPSYDASFSTPQVCQSTNTSTLDTALWTGIWGRVLSSAEIKSLSDNPWQLFEPETIPLFVPTGTGPVTHPTTGDVVGNTATVTGSAVRETGAQTHPSTGDVVGNTATVSGTALRYRAHPTTGVVAGLTSNVTGTAKRYRLHTTTGTVAGLTSIITGSAVNEPAAGVHETTGDVVAGTGSVSGTATHIGVHTTTGVLAGFSAEVIGAAQRSGAVIVHDTSGVLAGYDSVVTGAATNQGSMTLTPADIQAIVAAIKAEIMPVNIVRVNGGNVDGDGSDSNPWGPV